MITLQTETLSLSFAPTTGGGLAAMRFFNGRELVDLLRPATDAAIAARDPQGLGCFVSMPYVSRIKDGVFTYKGQIYKIPPNQPPSPHPLHGQIWRRPAQIVMQGDNACTITHDIEENDYPFRFHAQQDWRVEGNVIDITFTQTNKGCVPLPFGMGLHPFFNKTEQVRLKTGVDKAIINDADVIPVSLDPLPPAWDFTKDFLRLADLPVDNCFTGWNRRCDIEWPDLGAALTMTADERFGFFVVCSPENDNWFCANPVSHFNDAYNNSIGLEKTGLQVLQPGESMSGNIRLTVRTL